MNEYSGGNYLVYRSSFLTTRVIGDYLEPVEFELEVGFQFGPTEAKTANDQNNEQTIAYNKIEFFVEYVLNKSIFVSQHNGFWHEIASLETSNNYVVLHQEPYDDLITKYLYYKMQAISFPAFMMVDLSVWSSSTKLKFNFVGEEICTLPSIADTIGELAYHAQPWYHRDDCDTRDYKPTTKKDLDNPPENSVNFDIIFELLSNSKHTGEIVDIQKFKPSIV
tara:strand:+ start:30 stop:695 length:666 start_codon:yes stop_codon:yes gene_type:complete